MIRLYKKTKGVFMPIVITIPNIIREKLGDKGAEALTELFNKIEEHSKEDIIEFAEQRFEKRLGKLDAKIEKVKAELGVKIERVRPDFIKWMFIFWVGQIGVLIGILFAFFK